MSENKGANPGTKSTESEQVDTNEKMMGDEGDTPNTDEKTGADGKTDKERRMEALRNKNKTRNDRTMIDSMEKMRLFDSTKASGWATTGSSSMGTTKVNEGEIIVSGRNIGAEQREPQWTPEQMAVIRQMDSTTLGITSVTDTRRSVADPDREYVTIDPNNTLVPTEKAYVSSLNPDQYTIGIGVPKYDTTGSPRYYADVVIVDINSMWMVNQWTSEGIVIEGVANNVLMQQNRVGNVSGRRIGYHFARIGLPKFAFGALFNTLREKYPGTFTQVTPSEGYLWMNASWGVSSLPATFSYMSTNGLEKVTNLIDVMRIINGKSSLCVATVAISITCASKMVEGKPQMDQSSYGLSVKLHNAFHIENVNYHGPPQQGSTGMMVPSRIASKAQIINRSGASNTVGTPSIFGNATKNLFTQAAVGPPTIKSADNNSFM